MQREKDILQGTEMKLFIATAAVMHVVKELINIIRLN